MTERWQLIRGPFVVRGREAVRVAIIRDEGWPYDTPGQQEVISQAMPLLTESVERQALPTPAPHGWLTAIVHPDMRWQDQLSPHVAEQVRQALPDHPPSTAVVIVVMFDPA